MDEPKDIDRRLRRRRQGRRSAFFLLVAGILVFAAASAVLYLALRPTTLRIAVGPDGSEDQKLIFGLARAFTADDDPVRLSPITTDGSPESIALLRDSKTDLAVTRGDLDLPVDANSVAILRKNVVVLWSFSPSGEGRRRGARIKGIDDLEGHRVGVIGKTEANVTLLRVILKESGVNPDKVAVTQFGVDQVADMVKDRSLDAFMAVGLLDSKITSDAIEATAKLRGEPKFLPVDVSEAIAQRHPLYESEEIPGSTFSSSPARPDDKVETVSVNHLIIAKRSLSDTAVGAFVRQLFAVRQSVARQLPAAAHIEKPDTDKDAALSAHPGAAAYIDGTERTFLEKYSDYIWGSILLLSGLGSAAAWVRHYFKRDERERNLVHRDRMLAMISDVRKADSLDRLVAMQHEVDDLLRETLDSFDDGAIEEEDLAALGLVLEQFHHAVVDRRAVLLAGTLDNAGEGDAPRRSRLSVMNPSSSGA